MKPLAILKQNGYKLTNQRKEILNILHGSYPLTAQEIYDALQKKKINADLATVYRSVEMLVKIGVVHGLEFGEGKKRYELYEENHHHHHLICNNCGSIKDISIQKEEQLLKDVGKISDFKVESHSMEFFGLCAKCQ